MPNINRLQAVQYSKDIAEKRKISSTNQIISTEFASLITSLNTHLLDAHLEKTCNWMLYNDIWLDHEQGKLHPKFYNYSRGDIILSVDFGTCNIGTEIRYPHPGVVLYDNGEDWLVCAPITSCQRDKITHKPIIHEPFEVFIPAHNKPPKNPKEFHFKKDSVIQIDQIMRVSKHRAINKNRCKIRTDILNQIDNIILENYIPFKYKLLEKMKHLNKELAEELTFKENEINRLKKEIESLKTRNKKLEKSKEY